MSFLDFPRLCETLSSGWCREVYSKLMKTKPNTKPCPEPLDIPAQGSKPQHQNPPFPKAPGDPLQIHHQHILIPCLGCVFSFIYQQ